VSYVSDHYNQTPWTIPPFEWPKVAPVDLNWTPEAMKLLKELIVKVKELDAKLGLPDCEDPKKAEWMKSIEKRLQSLEAAG
jgi:hypothetical protein